MPGSHFCSQICRASLVVSSVVEDTGKSGTALETLSCRLPARRSGRLPPSSAQCFGKGSALAQIANRRSVPHLPINVLACISTHTRP